MKVFVAGGTGVVGRPAIPLLVKAGYEVSVIARSDEKAAWVEAQGATPVRVSLFDAPGLVAAVAPVRTVLGGATGPQLIPVLGATGRFQLLTGLGLAVGLAIGR